MNCDHVLTVHHDFASRQSMAFCQKCEKEGPPWVWSEDEDTRLGPYLARAFNEAINNFKEMK